MKVVKAPFWLAGSALLLAAFVFFVAGLVDRLSSMPTFFFPWHTAPNGTGEWLRLVLGWTTLILVSVVTLGLIFKGFKTLTDWTFGDGQAVEAKR